MCNFPLLKNLRRDANEMEKRETLYEPSNHHRKQSDAEGVSV